ncbi:MAG: PAC2 family protein [Pseudonocardiaceae bacterium]
MSEPTTELYQITDDPTTPEGGPVLVHSLAGFIDAGQAGRLAVEHLLEHLDSRVVATFDTDQLLDYRSRRPVMMFETDHWAGYGRPELTLHEVRDSEGTPFLLLAGPEPDLQWERFVAAVTELVERFGVRLTVGLDAVPMAVPHTRPVTVTAHATRPELVADHERWFGTIEVPASVSALLELRLGEAGHDAVGFAAHVPHYLARAEVPAAALELLDQFGAVSGLAVPAEALRPAADQAIAEVDQQIATSDEVSAVVRRLEQQFDATAQTRGRRPLPAAEVDELPTAEEIGAELEQFLAEQDGSVED